MEYSEAAKKVQAAKPKENFMVIEIESGYGNKLVLPHKDGLALIAALVHAEKLVDRYDEPKRIGEFDRDLIQTKLMHHKEYERFKVAALLNISPDQVLEMEKLQTQPQQTT